MNEAYQARPTEIMHGEIMRLFHQQRVKEVGKMKLSVMLNASDIAAMIVKAKNLANEQSLQDEAVELRVSKALGGMPESELWGDDGLIAATMRIVTAYEAGQEEKPKR